MKIEFLGAAGTVTGSKYLLEVDGRKLLVDCGLFQGRKELRQKYWSGYQAPGTRGQAILDGVREVKMHGQNWPVRCEIASIDSLSAHADQDGLLAWAGACPRIPAQSFVTHGEPDASAALAARLHRELGWSTLRPQLGDSVEL